MTYRKRRLNQASVDSLLAELGRARDACIAFKGAAPINEPHYRAAAEVCRAIDAFAEVATGDPTHFHGKMCPAPPPFRKP